MENSLICCCFAVRSCIAATQRWVLSSLWWKHTKTCLTEVNIYKLHSPTWSGRPAGISHQQSTEWEHKQTRLVPNNSERLHRSTIFSLPSVTCLTLVTRFFFFFFFYNIVFETDEAQWSKCLETNGEPLFWSFDLWDWKVLHKEQMMTVPTVVLYIIINFFLFFFSKQPHVLHVPTLY